MEKLREGQRSRSCYCLGQSVCPTAYSPGFRGKIAAGNTGVGSAGCSGFPGSWLCGLYRGQCRGLQCRARSPGSNLPAE